MTKETGLTLQVKLYARDGRKIAHEEVTFPADVADDDARTCFDNLVALVRAVAHVEREPEELPASGGHGQTAPT